MAAERPHVQVDELSALVHPSSPERRVDTAVAHVAFVFLLARNRPAQAGHLRTATPISHARLALRTIEPAHPDPRRYNSRQSLLFNKQTASFKAV